MKGDRATLRGLGLTLCGLTLLLLSGGFHRGLVAQRQAEGLQLNAPEDTTPLVALTTVAFGGFRGLVADALWVRAAKLQDEGEFFELVQLAKWIAQLEPRIPEVWSFQAWNLAYNISVLFPDAPERWRWVRHGLDLLRRQGLQHNPNSADLHWDIGWIYQHKIGMDFDQSHLFFKRELARTISEWLPEGDLSQADDSPETAEALWRDFSLRIERMRQIDRTYGSLDWRLPETHSLYWATAGLDFARDPHRNRSLRRMQMQSLGALLRRGRLLMDPETGEQVFLPRLDLIPVVAAKYRDMLAGQPYNHFLQQGQRNFLRDAMLLLGEYREWEASFALHEELAARDPDLSAGRENFDFLLPHLLSLPPEELTPEQAMIRTVAMIRLSLTEVDPIVASEWRRNAREVHQRFQQSRISREHVERTGLPDFERMLSLLQQAQKSGKLAKDFPTAAVSP